MLFGIGVSGNIGLWGIKGTLILFVCFESILPRVLLLFVLDVTDNGEAVGDQHLFFCPGKSISNEPDFQVLLQISLFLGFNSLEVLHIWSMECPRAENLPN